MPEKLRCYSCGSEDVTPIPGADGQKVAQCQECGATDEFYLFVVQTTGTGRPITNVPQLKIEEMWAAATGEKMQPDFSKMDRAAQIMELKTILSTMNEDDLLAMDEVVEALLYHLGDRVRTAWVGHNQRLAFPDWGLEE